MIQCMNVKKSYGAKRVLTNVNFSIEEHKIVALVGRNGAGKTTLLKMLAGHLKPTKGQLLIEQLAPFNNLTVALNTVFIHEGMMFPTNFTLKQILQAAGSFYPSYEQELAMKLAQYAQIDLRSFYDKLSKGQAATFRLIYGLCARCAYTYLDEPMNGMDDSIRADFYRAILKEYIAMPRTMIVSTHYLNEMRSLAEDVLILHNGQIELHTTADELSQFALKITGPKEAVVAAIGEATVLQVSEETGFYEAYVLATELDEQKLQSLQLSVQPVEAHVTARLLTAGRQGGIDDVYRA